MTLLNTDSTANSSQIHVVNNVSNEHCRWQLNDPADVKDNPACLIRLLNQAMLHELEKHLLPLDLTAAQWHPMALIGTHKANTAAELARLIEVDTGAMTRTLDRLEKKGLITRQRQSNDRRVVKLELTEASHAINAEMFHVIETAINPMFDCFTQNEYDTFLALLRKAVTYINPNYG